MSIFTQASKSDRLKIRREMLREAERLLAGIYPSKAQRKAAARRMVDAAIAKERKTANGND